MTTLAICGTMFFSVLSGLFVSATIGSLQERDRSTSPALMVTVICLSAAIGLAASIEASDYIEPIKLYTDKAR
jgi:hypothetical protein